MCEGADILWKWCAEMGQVGKLNIPELRRLPQQIAAPHTVQFADRRYHELLGKDGWELQTPTAQPLKVAIYPVQIHDTYALDFTLYRAEVDFSPQVFQELSLGKNLLNESIQASLGITLLLYAEPLNSPDLDRQVADTCVNNFLGEDEASALFVKQGRLLSGRMFEYDNLEVDPYKRIHILMWLNRNSDAPIGNLKQRFINLLYCRSKVLFAFHTANNDYNSARQVNYYLEQRAKEFPNIAQSKERLNKFKQMLKEIPSQSFAYADYLRSLNNHLTTVEINAKNYAYWLDELRVCLYSDDDLKFLEDFCTCIEQTLIPQIQAYLSYLNPGQEVYSKMLESICGLVEIEGAERDRRLEETIQVVSVALGVGGLVASSSPTSLQEKSITFFPQQQPFKVFPQLHPFVFSCLIILFSAGIAASLAYLFISMFRRNLKS